MEGQGADHGFFTAMPDELTSMILAHLTMPDLCRLAKTSRKMYHLANSKEVLSRVSFAGLWPQAETKQFFLRASAAGNLEASIKIGVACLYGKGVDSDADLALQSLCKVEELCAGYTPFVWLLFRPPWTSTQCSKACVFTKMRAEAQGVATEPHLAGRLYYCVAKTIALQENSNDEDLVSCLQRAELLHCSDATLQLYNRNPSAYKNDKGKSSMREKQLMLAAQRCPQLRFQVCQRLIQDHDVYEPKKRDFLRKTVEFGMKKQELPLRVSQPELDRQGKMRFILVDWLVEVASLKMYSSETLYCAVDLVDRYLAMRTVTRKTLQLLGITCMVIAARFTEQEIITIREAAWLTENTYQYENVVQMVAEVIAVIGGDLRRPSLNDYVNIFVQLGNVPAHIHLFMKYIAETTLLHVKTHSYSPASMGAAVFYIGMYLAGCKSFWPTALQLNTNLRVSRFRKEIEEVYACLFTRDKITDHRGHELRAVDERYSRALEGANSIHLRIEPRKTPAEHLHRVLQEHIEEEQRSLRNSAQTPTPPLPKFTGIPLCEITNVTADVARASVRSSEA
eukprot:m.136728 g.136728  ORF g.136728 m.136728 type:complete len:566 (-) comp15875_c0_seq1:463-2160(-)